MGFLGLFGKKGISGIPDAPTFQSDPYIGRSESRLFDQGNYLLNGLNGSGPELGGLLGETVQLNPQITQLALQNLQAQLAPSYRQSQQNLTNTLEANNQLTGSTTANSFQNLENDYLSQLTAAGAQASIADINRALTNRVGLYGTGLNTIQATGNLALNNQNQMNNFALQNYDNQLASVLASQPPEQGGLTGALIGAAGGALGGGTIAGPGGAVAGGLLGAFGGATGQPGTGGQFLNAGAGLYGNRFGNISLPSVQPGQINQGSASSIFSGESIDSGLMKKYPGIFGTYGLN